MLSAIRNTLVLTEAEAPRRLLTTEEPTAQDFHKRMQHLE